MYQLHHNKQTMLLVFCLFGFLVSATLGAPGELVVVPGVAVPAVSSSTVEPVAIVSEESDVDPNGNYKYSYESADGSKAEQSGELKEVEQGKFGEVIRGSYQYIAPSGKVVSVSYVADENGFQPQGEDLPQAPELPASVARALKFIEEHPQTEQPNAKSN